MHEPTISSVPGIFLRAVARTIARALLTLAGGFLMAGLLLVYVSLILATWRSARSRKTQLASDVILSLFAVVREMRAE